MTDVTSAGRGVEVDALMGPVDFLVVEFPGDRRTGEGLPALVDLVDQGIIRIIDLVFVKRRDDGSVVQVAVADLDGDGVLDLAVFEGAATGIIGDEEVDEAADVLAPGSSAAILVYENTWAVPFVNAMARQWRSGGGERADPGGGPCRRPRRRLTGAPDGLSDNHPRSAQQINEEQPMGLLRGVARTAVIAGTATAVSNNVSRRQGARWANQEAQQQPQQPPPQYQQQYAPPPPPVASQADDMDARIEQLEKLAQLRDQGILTDAEFQSQKQQLLT